MQETRVLSLGGEEPLRGKWQPTPVFLPGKSHEREVWRATVHGLTRVGHDLVTKPPPTICSQGHMEGKKAMFWIKLASESRANRPTISMRYARITPSRRSCRRSCTGFTAGLFFSWAFTQATYACSCCWKRKAGDKERLHASCILFPASCKAAVETGRSIPNFPGGPVMKNSPANTGDARDAGAIPGGAGGWGKIPLSRKWQSAPEFLPGHFHAQRSLVGYSSWGRKDLHAQLSNPAIYTQREEEKVLRKERWLDMEYALKFSSFMLVSRMRYPLTGVVVWIQVRRWTFRRQGLLLSLTLALSTMNKAGPEAQPVFKCDESCQWPTVLPRNDLSCVCTMTCDIPKNWSWGARNPQLNWSQNCLS